jgi:Dyggve-Melchior-Clausen syndrome protein
LLSNCCAVLMNLSSTIVDLHDYAAMRLASVTISTMKRYTAMRQENAAAGIEVDDEDEDDLSSPTAMHGEVARTLLRVLKHCLGPRSIEGNLHLVYALVYHQADFKKAIGSTTTQASPLFKKSEISRVQKVIHAATSIIEQADTRTATRALKVLSENAEKMKQAVADNRKRSDVEDFTFTYEEEVDPEIFFVPYVSYHGFAYHENSWSFTDLPSTHQKCINSLVQVWEVIVCAVTASSIEWKKNAIQVFPLLQMEDEEEEEPSALAGGQSQNGDDLPEAAVAGGFAKDVSDVV